MYAFQNEKKIFAAADHRFKQVVLTAAKGGQTQEFGTRFRMGVGDSPHAEELPNDILGNEERTMAVTPADVQASNPHTLGIIELRTKSDLEVFRAIQENSVALGVDAGGWDIDYSCEFHITNDSKHFSPLEKWIKDGYWSMCSDDGKTNLAKWLFLFLKAA